MVSAEASDGVAVDALSDVMRWSVWVGGNRLDQAPVDRVSGSSAVYGDMRNENRAIFGAHSR